MLFRCGSGLGVRGDVDLRGGGGRDAGLVNQVGGDGFGEAADACL